MSHMEQPTTNQPMPDYPRTPDGKYKYTTWDGEPKYLPSQELPGLGDAQILPDWAHNLWYRLLKSSAPSQ